jgi:hypothetical protein
VGIREKLNENPAITTGATIGIIAIAVIFIGYQLFSGSGSVKIPTETWYTTDDSSPEGALAAMFADDINKIPPITKDGKEAYRAYVFTCDGGKTKFVAYLLRYTKDAKAKLEAAMANPEQQRADPGLQETLAQNGAEVKRPGKDPWIKQSDYEKSRFVMDIKCPDGTQTNIDVVMPE